MGNLEKVLRHASSQDRAVLAFNAVDPTSMWGVLRGAEAAAVPVVVQMSERTAQFWGPSVVVDTFRSMRRSVDVDVVLHLDHSRSVQTALSCLEAGWDSVLLDVSARSFGDAVSMTRQVVERATLLGADVEGEFDAIPDACGDDDIWLSDPDECRRFVSRTGVACLAPALGTGHGRPEARPHVDLAHVRAIADATGVPLVLHGGTGLDRRQADAVASAGVAKINVSTALKERYLTSARADLDVAEPLRMVERVRDDVAALVREWAVPA